MCGLTRKVCQVLGLTEQLGQTVVDARCVQPGSNGGDGIVRSPVVRETLGPSLQCVLAGGAGGAHTRLLAPIGEAMEPRLQIKKAVVQAGTEHKACGMVPAEGGELESLAEEIADAHTLAEPCGLVLDGAGLAPRPLELTEPLVAHSGTLAPVDGRFRAWRRATHADLSLRQEDPGRGVCVSRRPGSPFLELGCYFDGLPYHQAVRRVVERLGMRPRAVQVERGAGLRDRPFARILETPLVERPGSELGAVMADPDLRVTRVEVEDGLGVVAGAQEIVAVLGARTPTLFHPVAVWTDGQAFSRPPGEEAAMRDAAGRAFRKLRQLVERVEPTYASLTLLSGLPAPLDLARGAPAPCDLFLSEPLLGLAEAKALFGPSGAKVEAMHGGVHVSAGGFNREGRALPVEVRDRIGAELGRRIAERLVR